MILHPVILCRPSGGPSAGDRFVIGLLWRIGLHILVGVLSGFSQYLTLKPSPGRGILISSNDRKANRTISFSDQRGRTLFQSIESPKSRFCENFIMYGIQLSSRTGVTRTLLYPHVVFAQA